MKALLLTSLLFSTLIQTATGEESRKFEMISDIGAHVKIKTDEEAVQAAAYVDGAEADQFIEGMLKLKNSPLAKIKRQVELDNCSETSQNNGREDGWIDGCGEVVITDMVRTEFGRGGWAEAGAGYTFFVGFRSDGTGRFTHSTHMVKIWEDVYAETLDNTGDFAGTLLKTYSLSAIKELESNESDSIATK